MIITFILKEVPSPAKLLNPTNMSAMSVMMMILTIKKKMIMMMMIEKMMHIKSRIVYSKTPKRSMFQTPIRPHIAVFLPTLL